MFRLMIYVEFIFVKDLKSVSGFNFGSSSSTICWKDFFFSVGGSFPDEIPPKIFLLHHFGWFLC